MVLNIHRNHKAYQGRTERRGERGDGGGGRGRLYTYHQCTVTTRMTHDSTRMTPALRRAAMRAIQVNISLVEIVVSHGRRSL